MLTAIGGCDDVFGRAETQPTALAFAVGESLRLYFTFKTPRARCQVELYDVENQHWTVLEHRLTHPRHLHMLSYLREVQLFSPTICLASSFV